MADEREPMSERQVSAVIRELSSEHAARVVGRDRVRAWRRIEASIPPVGAPARASGGGGRVALFVAAVAVAAGVLLGLGFRADSQLSYELSGAVAHDGVIEAKRGEATVSLSDGSSILAENQTKFSVDVVGRNSALTRLVSGRLHVRVEHNEDTSYRFIAGPYEVRVVGTEFHLGWDPQAGLTLAMAKGEVRLAEPGGKLHTLGPGQSLRLPGLEQALAAAPARAAEVPRPAAPLAETAERARTAAPDPRSTGWDGLVAKGQFAEVVQEAETLGVDAVLASRSSGDLKALGQAARYVGKRSLALRAFTALRERNRGSESARHAAFFLARLQEEQGNQAEALRWLGTYVKESPRGVYAAEAFGRRLSLTDRLRGRAAALPLAREYLERFPEGAYAQTARDIAAPSR